MLRDSGIPVRDVSSFQVPELTAADAAKYERLAWAVPPVGAEVLEESELSPSSLELESKLSGKTVALFGRLWLGRAGSGCATGRERTDLSRAHSSVRDGLMGPRDPLTRAAACPVLLSR